MEDVVRRSGVGRMTVYRRFARRDDLVNALAARETRRFLAAVDDGIAGAESPSDGVVEAFLAAVSYTRKHPILRRLAEVGPARAVDFAESPDAALLAMGSGFIARHLHGDRPGRRPRKRCGWPTCSPGSSPPTSRCRRRPRRMVPDLSLAGVRLVIADHAMGLPVLRTLSLCTCCRHYPGAAAGRTASLTRPAVSAFPDRVVGSACALSFSRLARRSLTLRPAHSRCHLFRDTHSEGFSHFVTSMAAPVASGWSVSPGGICTHWKAPPLHGAHPQRSSHVPKYSALDEPGRVVCSSPSSEQITLHAFGIVLRRRL